MALVICNARFGCYTFMPRGCGEMHSKKKKQFHVFSLYKKPTWCYYILQPALRGAMLPLLQEREIPCVATSHSATFTRTIRELFQMSVRQRTARSLCRTEESGRARLCAQCCGFPVVNTNMYACGRRWLSSVAQQQQQQRARRL